MKIKDLTKHQREEIERDEVGRWYLFIDDNKGYRSGLKDGIREIIKRIEDEIGFFVKAPKMFAQVEVVERINQLKSQLKLYKLMETLE